MRARSLAGSGLLLGALFCATRLALAADEVAAPVRTEAACRVPHFEGKVVSRVWAEPCSEGEPCVTARELTLEDGAGTAVFGVEDTTAVGGLGPPSLVCSDEFVILRYPGEELRFDFHGGRLRLAPADRGRIIELWAAPEARTQQGIQAHGFLAGALGLVQSGIRSRSLPRPGGVDEELVELAVLVSARDQLRAGRFQAADDVMAALEAAGTPAPSRKIATRLSVLRHELAEARRRTQPFSLGPRRFVGGAQRVLRTPVDAGGPPDLFFRGAELCVADVAPPLAESAQGPAWPEDAMHCFAPAATGPGTSEARAVPDGAPAAPTRLDARDAAELLAVVDGGALLALSHGELVLARGSAVTEAISPARARELVAASNGTRLVTRTASYFSDSRHVAQVAGPPEKTWEVLGKSPDGVAWVGTPLVSPDQRWVVAQSGDGAHAVSLWVFPIR